MQGQVASVNLFAQSARDYADMAPCARYIYIFTYSMYRCIRATTRNPGWQVSRLAGEMEIYIYIYVNITGHLALVESHAPLRLAVYM